MKRQRQVFEVIFWLLVAVLIVASFRAADQHRLKGDGGPGASLSASLFMHDEGLAGGAASGAEPHGPEC